jgi:hypothetical protein
MHRPWPAIVFACVLVAGCKGGVTAGVEPETDAASGADGHGEADSGLDVASPADASPAEDTTIAPSDASGAPITACTPPRLPAPPSSCPQSLCGNGKLDTNCATDDAGTSVSEECDGRDLGGATCAGLGYVGGTLACKSNCTLDGQGCESCGSDPRIMTCAHPVTPSPPATISLATTSTEIAVAWSEASAGGLHFTRFSPDLTVLSDVACFPGLDVGSVSLVSMTSGWLIATTNDAPGDTLTLVRLDAQGGVTWSSPIGHADGRPPHRRLYRARRSSKGAAQATSLEGSQFTDRALGAVP